MGEHFLFGSVKFTNHKVSFHSVGSVCICECIVCILLKSRITRNPSIEFCPRMSMDGDHNAPFSLLVRYDYHKTAL